MNLRVNTPAFRTPRHLIPRPHAAKPQEVIEALLEAGAEQPRGTDTLVGQYTDAQLEKLREYHRRSCERCSDGHGTCRAEYIFSCLRHGFKLPFCASLTDEEVDDKLGAMKRKFKEHHHEEEVMSKLDEDLREQIEAEFPAVEAAAQGQVKALNPRVFITKFEAPPGDTTGLRTVPKDRVCVDCTGSGLNGVLPDIKFQYASVTDAANLMKKEGWMMRVDLKKGYRQCSIHPDSRPYLAFVHRGQTYQYQTLPFGVSLACIYFSAYTALIADIIRQHTKADVVVYLDDFWLHSTDRKEVEDAYTFTKLLEEHTGLKVNHEKTIGPAQSLEFLGINLCSTNMKMFITDERRARIAGELRTQWLDRDTTHLFSLRQLRHIAGVVNWAAMVRPAGPSYMNEFYNTMGVARDGMPSSTGQRTRLSSALRKDMADWEDLLLDLDGFSGSVLITNTRRAQLHPVFSDASGDDGVGVHWIPGHLPEGSPVHVGRSRDSLTYGEPWREGADMVCSSSIAVKELYGWWLALEQWGTQMEGCTLPLVTDNKGNMYAALRQRAPRCTSGTSRARRRKDQRLSTLLTRQIFELADLYGICLVPLWVPRDLNTLADSLSHYDEAVRLGILTPLSSPELHRATRNQTVEGLEARGAAVREEAAARRSSRDAAAHGQSSSDGEEVRPGDEPLHALLRELEPASTATRGETVVRATEGVPAVLCARTREQEPQPDERSDADQAGSRAGGAGPAVEGRREGAEEGSERREEDEP